MMPLTLSRFAAATRDEVKIELQLIEGQLPTDLYGFVFFNTPAGSVNSGGTPIPEFLPDGTINPEYGSMIFNGDGMVFRFDLNVMGKITLQTGLMRTPCYYADLATKDGTAFPEEYHFRSLGIAREATALGSRNQLNTAFTMFKFPGDAHTRMTANFDAGRPWEINVSTLKIKTAIGANQEWRQSLPAIMQNTFQLVQATAHPSFDPVTREFFTVCFNKDAANLFLADKLDAVVKGHSTAVEAGMALFLKLFEDIKVDTPRFLQILDQFFDWILRKSANNDEPPFTMPPAPSANDPLKTNDFLGMENDVFLLKWTGEGMLKKWNVIDIETGKNIVIHQTMHQTNFSKDYIVLVDTSLKFALDIMITDPFPKHPKWDAWLRQLISIALLPYTPFYILKRSDLTNDASQVIAKKLMVDLETVHFSINYANPGNLITIHTAHNAASCAAEWVRPYDYLALEPDKPVIKNTIGFMTTGEMDIGRIGKFIINGETGALIGKTIISEKGFEGDNFSDLKAHTWAVGLNTFRDMISADKPVDTINQIFWQSYGLDYRFLTVFIKKMYENYANRIIPVDEIIGYYQKGIPFCLFRQNTHTMTLDDYYIFKMNQNFRSLQFIPRKKDAGTALNADPELDGYIFCTMVNGDEDISLENDNYSREIWIFDAAHLKAGPVCKLAHPEMIFAFTIHSAWMEDCVSSATTYNIPVKEDYDEVIAKFTNQTRREFIQKFMDEKVYPNFNV